MAVLSNTDDALIELIRSRLENNRTELDHMIDLLNIRIRESSNEDLVKMRRKIARLQENMERHIRND